MKTKRRTWVFIAEIIALIIFIFVFVKFGSDKVNPEQVFAYSRDMIQGETIEETDLISVPISSMTRTQDMITISEYASVVGKKVGADVFANNIVYRAQLTDIDEGGTIINQDLSNKILYSMPIEYIEGLAGHLKTGDKIDLLFTSTGNVSDGENENSFIYSKIFMRDIAVYNVNTGDGYKFVDHSNITEADIETASDTNDMLEVTSSEPTSITLILTPEQAEQLDARRTAGAVKILKRFEETQTHETLGFVIGNYGKIFSGNANAETGNLQIIDSYTDDDPNKIPGLNTNKGSVSTGDEGNGINGDGNGNGLGNNGSGGMPSVTGIPSTNNGLNPNNSNSQGNGNQNGGSGLATSTTRVG